MYVAIISCTSLYLSFLAVCLSFALIPLIINISSLQDQIALDKVMLVGRTLLPMQETWVQSLD